jgi:plastocyanin
MARARHWTFVITPVAILTLLASLTMTLGSPRARAQETSEAPHPAHIHPGTCDDLGDILAPLSDVAAITAGEPQGVASAVPVEVSLSEVEPALSDLLAAPHAINIHESAAAIQNYIACGDIGGRVVDGELVIGLQERNSSGYSGVAVLEEDDNDTDVSVYLTKQGAGAAAPQAAAASSTNAPTTATVPQATEAPTAAPAATEAPAAQEIPVDIREFFFSPDPVEVSAGGTITWTNQGTVPHTATAEDRGVLQSGPIQPGDSFSQVFDTAGTFNYFCEFHPNMHGTIIVK